jgi:DNA-binding transcriptional regulator YdaS (Cro superfamily)
MNKESFSELCNLVGGMTNMATMIGVSFATIRRKVRGESKITRGDELKVREAVSGLVDKIKGLAQLP